MSYSLIECFGDTCYVGLQGISLSLPFLKSELDEVSVVAVSTSWERFLFYENLGSVEMKNKIIDSSNWYHKSVSKIVGTQGGKYIKKEEKETRIPSPLGEMDKYFW